MPPEDSSIQVKCLPFQLRAYYVSEFSIRTNKRFDNKKEPDLKFNSLKFELDFEELDSEKGAQKSEHLKGFNLWEVRLNVSMDEKKVEENNIPYSFFIALSGLFSFPQKNPTPKDDQLRFVRINGPSILYGFVREIVNSFYDKGPYPSPVLPTISFYFPEKKRMMEKKGFLNLYLFLLLALLRFSREGFFLPSIYHIYNSLHWIHQRSPKRHYCPAV